MPRAMVLVMLIAGTARAADERRPTVGFPARIDGLVLPGPRLRVKPADRKAPVVLRIVEAWPHGTATRYDLEYYGLEPGRYDLKDYLERTDGAPAKDLPSIPVEIRSVLPAGQVLPHQPVAASAPRLGGYRTMVVAGAAVWVAGLIALLVLGRRRQQTAVSAETPRSLADYLRPLIERAMVGELTTPQRAELERTLLVYWGRRLQLEDQKPAQALAALRRHPEAGPLLEQLEAWLHRPEPGGRVDIRELLEPYRQIPADALEEGAPAP